MEPDYNINIDEGVIDNLADKAQRASDEYRNQVIQEELAASKEKQEEEQALSVQKDPRNADTWDISCLLYTSPSPRDTLLSRMPSSA